MELDVRLLAPIATAIGICVSVFLWILNQRKKELSYDVLFLDNLVKIRGNARKQLQVEFNGRTVDDARLAVVRLTNSGHLPINVGDYTTALSICFSAGSKVILADIAETQPADIDERCFKDGELVSLIAGVEKERVVLQPVLLNSGDSIILQILVRDDFGKPQLKGHLMGVAAIRLNRPINLLPRILVHLGAGVMAGAMLLVEPNSLFTYSFEDVLPYLLLFVLGYIMFSLGLNWPKPVLSALEEVA
jgi:hypothetical protein